MTRRITILPQADRDLDEQAVYLAEHANAEIGLRFYQAARRTMESLSLHPAMGSLQNFRNPALTGRSDVRGARI